MSLYKAAAAALAAVSALVFAAGPSTAAQPIRVLKDRAEVVRYFHGLGFRKHGSVERSASERVRSEGRTFPTFSSSFTVGGVTYPFR